MNFSKSVLLLFIVIFGLVDVVKSQDCGVCCKPSDHTKLLKNKTFSSSRSSSLNEIVVSFSHTSSLENEVGQSHLLDRYNQSIDSLSLAFSNSGVNLSAILFDGSPLVLGLETGNTDNTLDDIQEENGIYAVINEHKRCENIHINIHVVDSDYSGSGGKAGQATSNGITLENANVVIKYNDDFDYFVYLVLHEIGHNIGMGHEDGSGNGAFDYSHAYFSIDGNYGTVMYSSYLGAMFQENIYSNLDDWNGFPAGDNDHDNVETANQVIPNLDYFSFSYELIATQTSICPNKSVTIELETDIGDEFQWTGEHIMSAGNEATFQTDIPGIYQIIGSTINSSEGSCIWKSDTISIEVLNEETENENISICEGEAYTLPNGTMVDEEGTYESELVGQASNGCDLIITTNLSILQNEEIDSLITISSGEQITLPDGTILTDQNNGDTGTYSIEGGATNGCDLIVSWTVEVTTSTITISEDQTIQVFPNPFGDYLNIRSENITIEKLEIYSLDGELVHRSIFENSLNTSNLSNGMYVLKLYDDGNNSYHLPIVK